MPRPESFNRPHHLSLTLSQIGDAYVKAGAQARLDIAQRVRRFSHQVEEQLAPLADAAMGIEAVRCTVAVSQALEGAENRFRQLLKTELSGLDFSHIWSVVAEAAKEVVLYLGGGAVIGGAVGAAGGFFFGGVGAAPGAVAGASLGMKIAGDILAVMGLGSLAVYIAGSVPRIMQTAATGFASAWSAGQLPSSADGAYQARIHAATESFAQCKLLLLKAVLAAIVVALSRGQLARSELIKQLNSSKLGPRFGAWIEANEQKLLTHAALRPAIAAADDGAGPAARAAAPRKTAPPPSPREKPPAPAAQKNGVGKTSCPACLTVGHPVDSLTGNKILSGTADLDFSLAAPLPLVWQRSYSSAQSRSGWLGQGWSIPLSEALALSGNEVIILDAFEREVTFSLPGIGQTIFSPSEKISLVRTAASRFELVDENLQRRQFAMLGPAGGIAHLVGIVDANGNAIRILYNHRQLPERIHDSAGRTFILAFGACRGQPRLLNVGMLRETSAHEPLPANEVDLLVQYDYDDAGDLVRVRNCLGQVTREFAYRNHLMVEHAQPGGLVSRYEYDQYAPTGKVLRNWTSNGLSWRFQYLARETVVTDHLGRVQRYQFDQRQRYTGMVDAAGGITRRRLDEHGNLVSITDPAGRSTSYRYDDRSRVVRVERGGHGTGIVYHARFDKPALITDALGATTALHYDERGNLAGITDALGQRTSYAYNAHGLPIEVTDAAGGVKRLAYDSTGQLTTYTDCSGNTTHFHYDGSKLVRIVDAAGMSTAYTYDGLGRLLATVHPDGKTERYDYDGLGRLTGRTDIAGNHSSYVLDADGKPLERRDARGGVLAYRYDAGRRLAELINENGDVSRFVYDALDRLVEETGFDGRLTRYRYDQAGLVVAREECGSGAQDKANQILTHYLRDEAGRLVEKISSRVTGPAQAEQLRQRYAYDPLGRMTRAVNADADIELGYDLLGRLVSDTTRAGKRTSVLRHSYDELGNRIQTILPDGRVLNSLFYGSGHLHHINLDGAVITDMERDSAHRPTSRSQGALTSRFDYDQAGRLLSQVADDGHTAVVARSYAYDEAGNLGAIDDLRHGRTEYHYDAIGRVLAALRPDMRERFAFDPAHNLLDPAAASGGRVEGNRVRVFEDKRYGYDAHGKLTEKRIGRHTRMQFEWNAAHQMVMATVARHAGQDQPLVQTVHYVYDAFGRRICKRDSFGETHFIWDGDRLLSEARGSDHRTYVYEPGSFVPVARIDGSVSGQPADSIRAQVHYLHTDLTGTPREVSDHDGRLTWAASYKAWGKVLKIEAPLPEDETHPVTAHLSPEAARAALQPLRFQGQYHDVETGLHYNRFRYYDPDCGRFVSPDPIGLAGGNNAYQYAPNPVAWADPLGLSACACTAATINASTLDKATSEAVLNTEKGLRPNPDSYLSQAYRDAHAEIFRGGAARIQPSAPTGTIGRTETWVFPQSTTRDAIARAGNDVSKLEELLGLDKGYLGANPVLVEIPNPIGYRIPTGNEFGANGFWRPGGFTYPGGLPEAVIDPVPPGAYTTKPVFP
ncbi:DUF6531 domain-containing protein [Massilia oculi]|uniref:DUF6531 domain-containing protein n=1 Tax=Massilia hydrophila TaxID=3044279 RepID=A0ABS7YG89_9BURK|nr:RHS repeat-associated core domain-containing protein [Massilia oculi]MCA1857554.1 DUF6531 domain-containing protein [Massilia oculi]